MTTVNRAKILLITRNFPPLQGGMERLNYHIYLALRDTYEVTVIGPMGAENYCENQDNRYMSPPLPICRFLLECLWKSLKASAGSSPKLIIAGSGVTALPALLAGKVANTPVMTYLHGLDIVARHPIYRWIFLPAIRRSQVWLANSHHTKSLATAAGIPQSDIAIVHPGTDLPHTSAVDSKAFRNSIHAGIRPIMLSVGRLTRRKGILEFIENCLPDICSQIPEVLLVIVGGEPVHAIGRGKSPITQEIKHKIDALGLNNNVLILGSVSDVELERAYASSQLHVFPVQALPGDVEGFGMVAAEAAAHGVPTVAFAVGGVPDAIDDGVSGVLIEPGQYESFARTITEILKGHRKFPDCSRVAAKFAWTEFNKKICGAVEAAITPLESKP